MNPIGETSMKSNRTLNAALLIAALFSTQAYGTEVLAPGSTVAGKSIAAWSAEWWKWAWNSPAGADPLNDTTGALANQANDGPVFFLAGSNSNGSITRSFNVAAGKPLLVPMINYWENCPGDVAISCGPAYLPDPKPQMLANTNTFKSATTSIFATIDGIPVANTGTHWEVSDFFSGGIAQPGGTLTTLYANFGINIVGQDIAPSLASGYYVMVTGLAPGAHTLTYGGSTTAFGLFEYQVTANINVLAVPEPESWLLMLAGLGFLGWRARRRHMT